MKLRERVDHFWLTVAGLLVLFVALALFAVGSIVLLSSADAQPRALIARVGTRAVVDPVLTLALGTTMTTSAVPNDIVFPNLSTLRGVNAAGTDTVALVASDASNRAVVGNVNGIVLAGTVTQSAGSVQSANDLIAVAGGSIYWATRSKLTSPADSVVLVTNQAGTDFNRLQFGGVTAAFPSLKRASTELSVRLADDSGYGDFQASTIIGAILKSTGNVASAGTVRLLNNATIQARNAANTADIVALGVNASDQVALGPGQNVISGDGFLSVGLTPSTAGQLRVPNTGLISSRNAANTANLSIATVTAANVLLLGESGLAGITLDKAVTASSTMTIASTLSAQGGSNGQALNVKSLTESTTIAAAATTDTAIQIPANAVVLAVSVRVTTVIPTAATFTVTGTASGTTFSTAAVSTAAGSTDAGTASAPYKNGAAQTIRITPNLIPAAATGVVRVTIHYYDVTPPTS